LYSQRAGIPAHRAGRAAEDPAGRATSVWYHPNLSRFPMSSDPPLAPPSDIDALIARCLAGDQTAWEEIVRRHWRKVFNLAYKFVGRHDEAEDLTQDIFLKIFKALHTFDQRANFQTWLISISRNLCIDHYRSVRKERETMARDVNAADLSPASHDRGPYGQLEQSDLRHLIREALNGLAPALREAVMLRDLQEFSYQEIADRLQLPEGTVKSRINRGRLELARQIKRLQTVGAAARTPPHGDHA
jgi:RNA polymerase sigma-70 factor (ECF subfamily)